MITLMMSMSSSSCSVSNRFVNSSLNYVFIDPICFDPTCLVSTLSSLFFIN